MTKNKRRDLSPDEQHVLEHGHLRLLTSPEDIACCDQAIIEHHYLHDVTLVGEHLRYAFVYKGQWLAVATWSSAAFHLKDRDRFIGWTSEQCRRRLSLLANNSRLLVMPQCHYPNLVSRFMKLMLAQLSQDWEQRWGHPIALVETFVDPRFYQGTAYKVSGWAKPPVGSAMPTISTRKTTRPNRFGFESWSKKPASSCGRPNCRPPGPKSKKPARLAARPRPTRFAA